jgi:hypothetical protein
MRYFVSVVIEVPLMPIADDRNKGREEHDGLYVCEPWIEGR